MPSILVVDDYLDTCRVVVRLLRMSGYEADGVGGGPEALGYLRGRRADLVLLDIAMPEMDGFEVLRAIRADTALDRVAVLMYTAFSDPQQHDDALRLGAQGYVVKGRHSFDEITAAIDRHLSRSG
jgi:CheY-like chemotaxis protein